jgi:hypothetical protein
MRAPILSLLLSLIASPAAATQLVPAPLPTLVTEARSIVVGEVRAVTWSKDARGLPQTTVTVAVEERWKGTSSEATHVVRLFGDRTRRMVGVPTFTVGERVVLFDGERPDGPCPLVGGTQGVLRIEASALTQEGEPIARVLKTGLLRRTKAAPAPVTLLGAAPVTAPVATATLDELRSVVRALVDGSTP